MSEVNFLDFGKLCVLAELSATPMDTKTPKKVEFLNRTLSFDEQVLRTASKNWPNVKLGTFEEALLLWKRYILCFVDIKHENADWDDVGVLNTHLMGYGTIIKIHPVETRNQRLKETGLAAKRV